MKILNLICVLLLVTCVTFADAPPTFPTTFYGVITTAGGTPSGQTIQATLGASTASATVGSANLYNCGQTTCNYYLKISRASADTTSTSIAFTLNGHAIGSSTFNDEAPVRLDFTGVSASYLNGAVLGGADDIVAPAAMDVGLKVNGAEFAAGDSYTGTLPVDLYDGSNKVLSFNYDFSDSLLNLSAITISSGTTDGKAYFSVSGVNSTGGQQSTKTVTLYGASGSYNAVCVKNVEGVSYASISSTCTGANELQVNCDGTANSGITCTSSGTTRTVSGLLHSALIQFSIPAPAPAPAPSSSGSSSSGSGGSGGGSGSGSSSPPSSVTSVVQPVVPAPTPAPQAPQTPPQQPPVQQPSQQQPAVAQVNTVAQKPVQTTAVDTLNAAVEAPSGTQPDAGLVANAMNFMGAKGNEVFLVISIIALVAMGIGLIVLGASAYLKFRGKKKGL